MINSKTEKRAIYSVAKLFNEFDWHFFEPKHDFGIDAYVETSKNGRPNGKLIGIQIKGGDRNFNRSKNALTFYFSESHCNYWLNAKFPVLIILQDSSGNIYWEELHPENIKKAKKRWKIEISIKNRLTIDSKTEIENKVARFYDDHPEDFILESQLLKPQIAERGSKVDFSVVNSVLYCKVTYYSRSERIDLRYDITKGNWDNQKSELVWNDPYYYVLHSLKTYLEDKLSGDTKSELKALKGEFEGIISLEGIEGLARKFFNDENKKDGIPDYDQFIEAFKHYKGLKRGQFNSQVVGHIIHFTVDDAVFEMDTYEGKTAFLKHIINQKSYSEIYTETYQSIWSEIFIDPGIEKKDFIPAMLNEWEDYWRTKYREISEAVGSTDHLDQTKETSWRQLQVFIATYNDSHDAIKLASDLDDFVLFPLAVIAMLELYHAETCFLEYCELEFDSGFDEWESICVDDQDMESPIFHVKRYMS